MTPVPVPKLLDPDRVVAATASSISSLEMVHEHRSHHWLLRVVEPPTVRVPLGKSFLLETRAF